MKRTYLILCLMISLLACEKVESPPGVTSLSLFNATIGIRELATNFKGTNTIYYAQALKLQFGQFQHTRQRISLRPGETSLGLYQMPDTLPSDNPVYFFRLNKPEGSIHTLFLTGTNENPESILVEENFPVIIKSDSVMAIRFIHLSPNTGPVTFEVVNTNDNTDIQHINYKDYTEFFFVPVKNGAPNYIVRVRDQRSQIILSETTLNGIGETGVQIPNRWRNHYFTIAFIGDEDDTTSYFRQKISVISHTLRN